MTAPTRESSRQMDFLTTLHLTTFSGKLGRNRRGVRSSCRVGIALILFAFVLCTIGPASALTVPELQSRITKASGKLVDSSFVVTAVEKNLEAIEKVDAKYVSLYEFKTAKIFLKEPDKLRTEGKLGMVKFEYIINNGRKIVRAPLLKIRRESDYSGNPGKLNDALDFGIITPALWAQRRIEIIEDSFAASKGETKIRLRWDNASMSIVLWLDSKEMYLKRMERRDGDDQTKVTLVYSNHRQMDGVVWIPTKVEMFASDGAKVGMSEISDIKVNVGLADSLFK